jgi:hypothetical protein
VLDSFSRRILAWHLTEKLSPATTCAILVEAAKLLPTPPPFVSVITDSGMHVVGPLGERARGRSVIKESNPRSPGKSSMTNYRTRKS